MNQLYSTSKLIRALKQSASLINYVNKIDIELYSAISVLYMLYVLKN